MTLRDKIGTTTVLLLSSLGWEKELHLLTNLIDLVDLTTVQGYQSR